MIARRKNRWEERAFVVQGETLLLEALRAGWSPSVVLIREDFEARADLVGWLNAPGSGRDSVISSVDGAVFDALNDTATPQGILGVCAIPEPRVPECTESDWYIVVDQVADPGNLGTIVRSAEAAGASGVVVTRGTVDPFSPKVVRSSAGALFHVPIHFVENLDDPILQQMRLVGTSSHGGTDVPTLWEADLSGCRGFVFGNEPRGVGSTAPVRSWIRIPHVGRSESLNVAMAASVVAMYTAHRRGFPAQSTGDMQPSDRGTSD